MACSAAQAASGARFRLHPGAEELGAHLGCGHAGSLPRLAHHGGAGLGDGDPGAEAGRSRERHRLLPGAEGRHVQGRAAAALRAAAGHAPPAAAARRRARRTGRRTRRAACTRSTSRSCPRRSTRPPQRTSRSSSTKPAGAKLVAAAGLQGGVFASGLQGPRAHARRAQRRHLRRGDPERPREGAASVDGRQPRPPPSRRLRRACCSRSASRSIPAATNPKWLYVAETNRVVRYAYKVGDHEGERRCPKSSCAELSPVGGGHFTRDIAFSLDGKRMFVSVGSQSNVAERHAEEDAR